MGLSDGTEPLMKIDGKLMPVGLKSIGNSERRKKMKGMPKIFLAFTLTFFSTTSIFVWADENMVSQIMNLQQTDLLKLRETKGISPLKSVKIKSIKNIKAESPTQDIHESIEKCTNNADVSEEHIEKTICSDNDKEIISDYKFRDPDVMVTDRNKPNGHPSVAGSGTYIYAACEGTYSGYPCIDVYRTTNSGQSWYWVTGWYYASSTYEAYFPSIAVSSSYIVVTYDRRENGELATIRCVRIPLGGSTPTYYTVDEPDRGTTDIVAYGSTVYCVFRYTYSSSDWDIEFRRSTNGGASWSSRVTVCGSWPITLPLEMPKICSVTSNILVATWQHYSTTFRVDWSKSTNGGNSWSSAQMFTTQLYYPDVTGYQNTYLITCQTYPSNILTYVYSFNGGSNWSAHTRLSGSYYPQCTYGNGYWRTAYTRNNKVYHSAASAPEQLGDGAALTDLSTAQNDAIGIISMSSSTSLCLWKDSRNSTSIYSDRGYISGIEENKDKTTFLLSKLEQNYPNPIRVKSTIKYVISKACDVEMRIFDVSGKEIEVLVDKYQEAGSYHVNWDIRNISEKELPNGIYFYRFTAGTFIDTKKIVVVR
ncbi:T9SS type A sorting domain-containing protein [candidate division WOR-3 bacterium]|nr:T9SS type A sorting domain-containing protein [candidate division WOR-3 bacterium]